MFYRNIFYFKNYFLDFFEKQNPEVKNIINLTLELIATIERVPEKYFKHISGSTGIYEIRIEVSSNIYRVFCIFDKEKLIVLFNDFKRRYKRRPKMKLN